MHEHVVHREGWPPLPGTLNECKTHRYVAIIEELNHTLKGVSRDYKEITLFRQCGRQARIARDKTIPTSGEISLFIIAFL